MLWDFGMWQSLCWAAQHPHSFINMSKFQTIWFSGSRIHHVLVPDGRPKQSEGGVIVFLQPPTGGRSGTHSVVNKEINAKTKTERLQSRDFKNTAEAEKQIGASVLSRVSFPRNLNTAKKPATSWYFYMEIYHKTGDLTSADQLFMRQHGGGIKDFTCNDKKKCR